MNAAAVVQVVQWGAELIKAVVDAVSEAVKGPEPPTLAKLKANVQAAIDARTSQGDWIAAAKKEADAEFAKAAADPQSADDVP